MDIPQALRVALEHATVGVKRGKMVSDAQTLSKRYRTEGGRGDRLLTLDTEAVAYAAARMPATFCASFFAIKQSLAAAGCVPKTLLDVGAGTGSATWAAAAALDLERITCLERERAMRKIGESMMADGPQALRDANWISHDLTREPIPLKADLVVASYVLNEMSDPDRMKTVKKLWDAAGMMLLLIEPGTPAGFSNLKAIRSDLLGCGAFCAAPCPHNLTCPKTPAAWCHFACRVSRSRLHRQLKGGEVAYEDEKFSYLALTHEAHSCQGTRVLAHPQIRKGHVILETCTDDKVEHITISKKTKSQYKLAKKVKWGEILPA
jgi:ribosomal protein RSM22 (predicted rRNA methylase)